MKCIHCQGELERGAVPFHVDRRSYHVTLDNIPAWVCTQCGEALFDEEQVDAVQDLMAVLDRKSKRLVPIN